MEKQIIKAIETEYNGYRFRSRLEARWAVFFDAAGIKYEYEPEGFELDDGTKYLPDFYLPDFDVYVEIKNINAFTLKTEDNTIYSENGTEDGTKYLQFAYYCTQKIKRKFLICFGDPYDAQYVSRNSKGSSRLFYDGTCLMHKIASENKEWKDFKIKRCGKPCNKCNNYRLGMCSVEFVLMFEDIMILVVSEGFMYLPTDYSSNSNIKICESESLKKMSKELKDCIFETIYNSAIIARQVRFEHGETPTAKQVYEMARSGGVFNAN